MSVTCSSPGEGIWSSHLVLIRDQSHLHALTDSSRSFCRVDKFHSTGSSATQHVLGSSWVQLVTGSIIFSHCTNPQTLSCAIFLCWSGFPGPYCPLVMLSWDYTRCGICHALNNFSLCFFSYCCNKMPWEKTTRERIVYFSTEFKVQSFMAEDSRQQ